MLEDVFDKNQEAGAGLAEDDPLTAVDEFPGRIEVPRAAGSLLPLFVPPATGGALGQACLDM
jgi:hypothetical protein